MSSFFRPEGTLWRILNTLTDIFALSLLWLFCCIPVVTIGSATTALYDAVVHCIRYGEAGPYRRFFRTFRADLAISIGTTVLWGIVLGFCFLSLNMMRSLGEASRPAAIASIAYYILLIFPIGAACWVFPILSRFTYSFRDLNFTALKVCIGFLPRTVIIVLITVALIMLCIQMIFPAFFVPACMMLLWSLFTEPVFAKLGGGLGKNADLPDQKTDEEES